jgi:His/Glu/Gln/Arg/opine family amino acid ABC transporter permease subunit
MNPIGVYNYDWSLPLTALPTLLRGLRLTFEITVVASLASLLAGSVLGLMRAYGGPVLGAFATAYIYLFRSLSPYIYLLWVYFGIAIAFGVNLSPFAAGVVSLTLLYAAYFAEIIRAALQTVDKGQTEAALSLGMAPVGILVSVMLPQAARTAVPPLMSSTIVLLKDSSLVAVIGAPDLMYVTIGFVEVANHPFEFYTVAALLYFLVVAVLSVAARRLERWLSKGVA